MLWHKRACMAGLQAAPRTARGRSCSAPPAPAGSCAPDRADASPRRFASHCCDCALCSPVAGMVAKGSPRGRHSSDHHDWTPGSSNICVSVRSPSDILGRHGVQGSCECFAAYGGSDCSACSEGYVRSGDSCSRYVRIRLPYIALKNRAASVNVRTDMQAAERICGDSVSAATSLYAYLPSPALNGACELHFDCLKTA